MSEHIIPIIEEEARLSKQSKVAGRVTVRTRTEVDQELASIDLARDGVEVSRVPMDVEVDDPPAVRTEGDVTIVPIVEERAVIRKQLVLVEEIHIRKSVSVENVEVPITTRHQTVRVERSSGPSNPPTELD
jgi:stress response protein YsnF